MIPADPPGRLVLARGQRPDAGEDMHNLVVGDRYAGKHAGQRVQHVALLVLQAERLVGIVDPDVGRADHRRARVVESDADASVAVLVVDHVAVERLLQRRVAHHQVRALGALYATAVRGRPDRVLDAVDPCACRIHHQPRCDEPLFAGQPVAPAQRLAVATGHFGVGEGARVAAGLRNVGLGIEHHLQPYPLGMADLVRRSRECPQPPRRSCRARSGAVRSGRSSDAWAWSGFCATADRRALSPARITRPDRRPRPAFRPRNGRDRRQCPAKARRDGDQRRQRRHVMRRVLQQPVALLQRLPHQMELAVLEIAQAAMHHARQRSTCARAEIVALQESTTSTPCSASSRKVLMPLMPPPMTTTSAFSGTGAGCCISVRLLRPPARDGLRWRRRSRQAPPQRA